MHVMLNICDDHICYAKPLYVYAICEGCIPAGRFLLPRLDTVSSPSASFATGDHPLSTPLECIMPGTALAT